jgi:hypothetical protein
MIHGSSWTLGHEEQQLSKITWRQFIPLGGEKGEVLAILASELHDMDLESKLLGRSRKDG